MRKVTYIEVKRKRGSFWKEVNAPRKAGSSNYIGTPSTSSRQRLHHSDIDDYSTWNDIPIDFPHRSKVSCIHLRVSEAYNDWK